MATEKKFIGIIPARYASSRFPGKPLAIIHGKSMIRRVYEQAVKALDVVYVATDDQRIFDAVSDFGGRVAMTSETHKSGTDRCAEALQVAEKEQRTTYDAVLNVQGDEPFIQPQQLELLKSCFLGEETEIATLVKEVDNAETLTDPNRPKVIINAKGEAIYFSRSIIPYLRGVDQSRWVEQHTYYIHIGLYGFRRDVLPIITQLQPSALEKAESLEQLRWIEHGFKIAVRITQYESFGVDTPEDLKRLMDNP
jgi:3-deoxy-manno-octulosonate cytidylyltransferase (CMP-KDO synthetase)